MNQKYKKRRVRAMGSASNWRIFTLYAGSMFCTDGKRNNGPRKREREMKSVTVQDRILARRICFALALRVDRTGSKPCATLLEKAVPNRITLVTPITHNSSSIFE